MQHAALVAMQVTEEVAVGTLPAVAYSALVFYLVRCVGGLWRLVQRCHRGATPSCSEPCTPVAPCRQRCPLQLQAPHRPTTAACPPRRLQGSFLLFFLIYYVSMCVAISLSLLAGAISPTVDVAGAVLPAYATTLMFFSGVGCDQPTLLYCLLAGSNAADARLWALPEARCSMRAV